MTRQEVAHLMATLAIAISQAEGVPVWVLTALAGLAEAGTKLIAAKDDAAREEAAMVAAESVKSALDAQKFGA